VKDAMRIKVDEDLPRMATTMLRERGYDAASVLDQGLGGRKDPDLWEAVQAEQRFLVTADKGFADVRYHPPGTHAGVLLLRPDEDGIRPIVELLERALRHYDLTDLAGTVTVASPRGVRVRRAR
jgi:predicted nuclease of predicted toxin-antitoxin system